MLLTQMQCDGCGRKPSFMEWFKGELTSAGYPDWRHPAIIFKEAGYPIAPESMGRAERLFEKLFGKPMPDDMSYLCPNCQARAEAELPALGSADTGPMTSSRNRFVG
jgi:hypothetical protein